MAQPEIQKISHNNDIEEDDETDAILAELEAETSDPNSLTYQQRIQELQSISQPHISSNSAVTSTQEHYITLKSDNDTLQFTTEHEKAIVHFRHPDFARCATMDSHLERIAQRHGSDETGGEDLAFARVDVAQAPFVVEKLGVRVLPCVIGFVRGIVKGRVVGFEGVCWDGREGDASVTKALEEQLVDWGLLKKRRLEDGGDDNDEKDEDMEGRRGGRPGREEQRRGIKGSNRRSVDDEDDWD